MTRTQKQTDNKKKLEQEKKAYVHSYKMEKGCAHCGYNESPYALQLDHIDPDTKDLTTKGRHAVRYGWSYDKLNAEIAKCQVLCANCHSIKTMQERGII